MADPREMPACFDRPGTSGVSVQRNLSWPDSQLRFDVYTPAVPTGTEPGVLFVHGDAPPEQLGRPKEWAQFTSWGRLVAASDMVAFTFNRRSTEGGSRVAEAEGDVRDMLNGVRVYGHEYGVDVERLAIWVCSAGPPTVVPFVLREQPHFVRCLVVYYGLLDVPNEELRPYSAVAVLDQLAEGHRAPPLLLARGGLDRAVFNDGIDRFVSIALARRVAVEMINHPDGEHAFDVRNDVPRTREIIARTLDYLRWHTAV
jgi:acetyl esterase/lipase